MALVADAEGFNAHRRPYKNIRLGQAVKVRRSPQAVACRKRDVEARGKPQQLLGEDTTAVWYTAPEARKGKPGHRTMREPGRCGGTHPRQAAPSRQRDDPLDAPGVSYHAEYSEVGKARHTGKDMTEVRSPHRTLLPDTGGSDHQKPTSLQGLANTAKIDTQHRLRDLYGCLHADLLLACWGDLNKQAARGVDGLTAQAYEVNLQANITALAQRLQGKRYRATRVRRCDIPKENGSERPLGIPALEDTLGQAACAKLLTAISAQDC